MLEDQGIPVMVRGEGPYLIDQAGMRYVDAISSWWCSSLGHNHPRVMEAIRQQTETLDHCILGNQAHPGALRLSRRLAAMMPDPASKVHYASDGSCSIEAALKISLQSHSIRDCPQKVKFASLREAYHGDTLAAVALGFLDHFHASFEGAITRAMQIEVPPFGLDLESATRAAEDFFFRNGAELAALVIEPVCQGTAGIRFYPPTFLQSLQFLCREYSVVLIADEIATGFFRTGTRFAFEHAELKPDIICLGKALTAGTLPLSAAVVTSTLYDLFTDRDQDHCFYHGHTFAGNPLGCAAALAALEEYERSDFEAIRSEGALVLKKRTEQWRRSAPDFSARSLGHIAAVQQPGPEPGASREARRIQSELLHQGILIRPLGPVTYIMPPLNTPAELLMDVLDAWEEAFLNC